MTSSFVDSVFGSIRWAGKRLIFGLSLVVLIVSVAQPVQAQIGGASAVFLEIEPDSRAAAMGNASVALADNANAVFWNPAGLAQQRGLGASITHSQWLPGLDADLFYDYLVGKYHVEGVGTFGGHITYFDLGDHEYRDEQNNKIGTFSAYETAVGASYGVQVSERLDLGTGARFIYSNLTGGQGITVGSQETQAGVSVGVDVGALYRVPEISLGDMDSRLAFGANLANMGPKIRYSDRPRSDPIPTNLRFGWRWTFSFDEYNSLTLVNDFNKLLVDVDSTGAKPFYKALVTSWQPVRVNAGTAANPEYMSLNALQQLTLAFGLEYWYNDLFALRTGYFYENPYNGNRQFLTFGAGIRYNIIGVDFSYLQALEENHPLANTLRFSLLLNIGGQ